MNYIKGKFKKSIFNGDNGYVIGLFKVESSSPDLEEFINTTVTFTGYFHELNESDTYILNGDFVIHKKYGEKIGDTEGKYSCFRNCLQ